MTNEIMVGIFIALIVGMFSGAFSAFISVHLVKNDIDWIKRGMSDIFKRLHAIETKGHD